MIEATRKVDVVKAGCPRVDADGVIRQDIVLRERRGSGDGVLIIETEHRITIASPGPSAR